jgi:hypothetical protein
VRHAALTLRMLARLGFMRPDQMLGLLRVLAGVEQVLADELETLYPELEAPTGQRAILHNRSGGSADNLRGAYDKSAAPGLETLVGEEAQGEWTLAVYDLAPRDTGKLEVWAIRLAC